MRVLHSDILSNRRWGLPSVSPWRAPPSAWSSPPCIHRASWRWPWSRYRWRGRGRQRSRNIQRVWANTQIDCQSRDSLKFPSYLFFLLCGPAPSLGVVLVTLVRLAGSDSRGGLVTSDTWICTIAMSDWEQIGHKCRVDVRTGIEKLN